MAYDQIIYILAATFGWFVAQGMKFALSLRQDGFTKEDLFTSGGMPSSHSAFVASVTTVVGLTEGFDSAIFGVALMVVGVVVYDAVGVRRATGENTQEIREIMEQLKINNTDKALHLALGHTPLQVVAGLIVGVTTGTVLFQFL